MRKRNQFNPPAQEVTAAREVGCASRHLNGPIRHSTFSRLGGEQCQCACLSEGPPRRARRARFSAGATNPHCAYGACVILPGNDDAGRAYADKVATSLQATMASRKLDRRTSVNSKVATSLAREIAISRSSSVTGGSEIRIVENCLRR